jgi:hypothetical protein
VKNTQRLDYHRFAEALVERGLVERDVLNHILQQCSATGALLPELLVGEDLVSDWELSRVVCELFHLPFLTVDICPPHDDAWTELDPDYLRQYGLVPMDRYGKVLTVVMPGIVPTEVLEGISLQEGGRILPLVGSVNSNRRWLQEHLPPPAMPTPDPSATGSLEENAGWTDLFDAGEQAVQLDLKDGEKGTQ